MWMNTIASTLPHLFDAAAPRSDMAGARNERSRPHGETRDTGELVDVLVTAIEKMLR